MHTSNLFSRFGPSYRGQFQICTRIYWVLGSTVEIGISTRYFFLAPSLTYSREWDEVEVQVLEDLEVHQLEDQLEDHHQLLLDLHDFLLDLLVLDV